MDGLRISKSGGLPPAAKLIKQFAFGTAVGLTKTAGEAQDAVKGALRGKFTIRNKWMDSPIGIKRKAANKNDVPIAAEISTAAKFMKLQDEGGPKLAYRNYLAIPIIPNARPSKNALIPKRNLPKNLKNAFVITTKSGKKFLCIRNAANGRGKFKKGAFSSLSQSGGRQTSGLVPMYRLIKEVPIKAKHVFYDPIKKVVDRRMLTNVNDAIDEALRTAK